MRIEDQRHVVVVGTDSHSLSELALRIARRLHRPFLDNCSFAGVADRGHGADRGVQDRLERMLAQSTPSVITVSTDDELSMPGSSGVGGSARPWVVVVDGSASVGPTGEDRHVDMVVDSAEAADDDLLDRVVEQFHSARSRR